MSEALRVSFCLANSGIGGSELNAVRTAERIDRDRYDLEVISFNDYAPLRERYERAGVSFKVVPLRSLKGPDLVVRGLELARHLRNRKTDVFHAHDSYGNLFGVPWARMAGVPGVVASRRWWEYESQAGHVTGNRLAYRLAHRVLGNTGAVAERLAREGVAQDKIRVVPNFLDPESFSPPGDDAVADFRAEFGIPSDARVVGIVAQLRPEKDHLTLLRAAAQVHRSHPDTHFVLVGEGECRPSIEALRAELGLVAHVHLAGLRRDSGNLHHLFDLSVLCSTTEALSNSLLEAIAAGNAVVATDVGGNPDVVKDGTNGRLCPPGDADALAAAMSALLSDEDEARRLGEAGLALARSTYTTSAAMRALEDLYAELPRRHAAVSGSLKAHAA